MASQGSGAVGCGGGGDEKGATSGREMTGLDMPRQRARPRPRPRLESLI